MADHTAKLVWKNGMTFEAVSDGKSQLPVTFSSSHLSDEEGRRGLSPMGMVLAALVGCTAMDVISILSKKRQEVSGFEIEVDGEQVDEHPRVYDTINVVYRVYGKNVSEEAVARAIELSVTKYCPVNAILRHSAKINYRHEIFPAE
jgi:putative redox protein